MQGEAAVGEQAHVDDRLGLMPGAEGEHCKGDKAQGQRPAESPGEPSCRGIADAEDQTGKAQNHQEHVQRTQSSMVVICRYRNRGYAGQAGHQRDEQYENQDDEDETPSDGGRYQTAEGGADSRSDGRNQGAYAHHGADALCRDFLEDDVEHQGQSDAGAQPLYGPSQQQEQEDRSQRVDDQCDQEEQVLAHRKRVRLRNRRLRAAESGVMEETTSR